MDRLRYVVLRHEGVPAPHFDLMFEAVPDGELMTWRAPDWPITTESPLTRLGNHRRDYLEYEGPLSDDRGHVKRVAAGACQVYWPNRSECTIHFDDPPVTLQLRQVDQDHWLATPQ